MARSWFDKIVNFIGYSDREEELEGIEEGHEEQSGYEEKSRKQNRAPVLSLHSSPEVKIIIMTPDSFDEAEKAANHLKNRKPVVINFNNITKEAAQRIIDFLAGTVFALNGNMQRVSEDTFLFVPSNMTVYSDIQGSIARDQFMVKLDRDDAP